MAKILEKYKVGKYFIRYICTVWERQRFVLRQAGFYSNPIDAERGRTQGDVDSPIIFNIIIGAVLWKRKTSEDYGGSKALFYADDELVENNNNIILQNNLNNMIGLSESVGLKTNETKSKFMIFRGPAAPKAIS